MRLWEDGFDHYGVAANMLDGSYAQNENVTISAAQSVTGGYSAYHTGYDENSSIAGLRWVLPVAIDKVGAVSRFYFPSLPSVNTACGIFDFVSDAPNRSQVICFVDGNGALRFYRGAYYGTNGDVGTLLVTTDPLISSNSWNHIEVQIYSHDTLGWIRVAVNGVHRFEATGLDTAYNATKIASIAQHKPYYGGAPTANNINWYQDDYYIYDFTGNSAVDTDFCPTVDGAGKATSYIGELQVWPLFPNGDTAQADWQKSTGVDGYALIDEHSPDDGDYIFSTAAADLSEFALDDLPVDITYIRGLGIHGRLSKSDAGAAMIKLGMKSVLATDDADARPVTTIPTYWRDPIDVDPNSSARWTRDSLNAAWLRLTRSA